MLIENKALGVLLVLMVLGFGLACDGGGGGGGSALPTLPEGDLYFSDEGWMTGEYLLVDTGLDSTFVNNNYGNPVWLDGLLFWFNCFSEDGFHLVIEPYNIEESIARLSVALHNHAINFTPETWDFIEEDPAHNLFIVLNIMNALSTGSTGVLGLGNTARNVEITITAGGEYQKVEKEDASQAVDELYNQLPAAIRLVISKEKFRSYLSQLIYKGTYVGGGVIPLSTFLEMLASPLNWSNLDFKVTVHLSQIPIPTIDSTSITASSGKTYRKRNLFNNSSRSRVYIDGPTILFTGIPEKYLGLDYIQTSYYDASASDTSLLTFRLLRDATLYVALDSLMDDTALQPWLDLGFEATGDTFMVTNYPGHALREVYAKEVEEGTVVLPGLNNPSYAMYTVFASAGTFNLGLEIISCSHTTLMVADPAKVASYLPGTKEEGGIVATSVEVNGDTTIVHANFVSGFDANVFLDTEDNADSGLSQVTPAQFVGNILRNDGFRLIDTYNDQPPAFGYGNQTLYLDNLLGYPITPPIEVTLRQEELYTFTNMNLLNSPNLCGIYLKSITTDHPSLQLWEEVDTDTVHSRKLNYSGIMAAINGLPEENFTYFYSNPESPITFPELMERLGKSVEESELTFGVKILLSGGYTLEIRAGLFVTDYFTDVYDAAISGGFF